MSEKAPAHRQPSDGEVHQQIQALNHVVGGHEVSTVHARERGEHLGVDVAQRERMALGERTFTRAPIVLARRQSITAEASTTTGVTAARRVPPRATQPRKPRSDAAGASDDAIPQG